MDNIGLQETPIASVTRSIKLASFFLAFVCIALLGLNVQLVLKSRTQEINQISQANKNLAHSISQQVDGSISDVDHVLDNLVYALERTDLSQKEIDRLQPMIVNSVAKVPQLQGLFIYDAKGNWLLTSEAAASTGRNNSDREYFQYHVKSTSNETYIGKPVISRSSGDWIVPISRRLNGPDGSFFGVALATLPLVYYKNLLERFDVGKSGAVAIIRNNQLLARIPFVREDFGKTIPASSILLSFASVRAETVEIDSPLDGTRRFISFDHTPNYPLVVAVAVGKDEVLKDWRSSSIALTCVLLVLCAMTAVTGFFLARAVRLRTEAQRSMAQAHHALSIANSQLTELAQIDGLTGVANRRHFDSRLKAMFAYAQRHGRPLALIMIDIDDFKKYNDHYGHPEGDMCLKAVALALGTAIRRPEDLLARYGGEEFVFLLPDTDSAGAIAVAEAAKTAVSLLKISHEAGEQGTVSISAGVAAWIPALNEESALLIKLADTALYTAKDRGRNRVEHLARQVET